MDIQEEKLRLIQWLAGINDATTINELISLKKTKEEDWWDEKAEIEEGLDQANRGDVIPHDQVMAKYKKWL